jgi:hypothetical protein
MSANFLIVCGGTGKGIVTKYKELNFVAAMQIDVQDELVQQNDGRVLKFPLPIANPIDQNLNSVGCLVSYKERLVEQLARTSDATEQSYITKQIAHVEKAVSKANPVQLTQGMSQNPIIGRAYITRPLVTQQIQNDISQMLGLRPNDEQDVVVWLISSTCGGTGNGIVHHIADIVQRIAGGFRLTIKFIRIGSLTYSSLNPLVHLATFWSVMTDYGYMWTYLSRSQKREVAGQLQFYYIDLPDVGLNKEKRENLVLSSFSAISDANLVGRFNAVLNNVTPSVVLARVGEWGRGFDRNSVYQHTLAQLKNKLDELLIPNPVDVLTQSQNISFQGLEGFSDLLAKENDTFKQIIENQQNQATILGVKRFNTDTTTLTLEQLRQSEMWSAFENLISMLVVRNKRVSFIEQIKLTITTDADPKPIAFAPRENNENIQGYISSPRYIEEIRLAQRSIARIRFKLLGDNQTIGMLSELISKWNNLKPSPMLVFGRQMPEVIESQFVDDKARQISMKAGIQSFLNLYFQVARMLETYNEAVKVVVAAGADMATLTRVVNMQREAMGIVGNQLTEAAELDEPYGRETWLGLLMESLQGDVNLAIDNGTFRRVVELGARGLTAEGLIYVLEMQNASNTKNIVDKVNRNVGGNQAVWWQGLTPQGNMGEAYQFRYRVFPKLPSRVKNQLESENIEWGSEGSRAIPDYIQISSSSLGLKVYAVECTVPDKLDINQMGQLIAYLKDYVNKHHNMYPKNIGDNEEKAWYLAHQCQRSLGLQIRCPEVWKTSLPDLYNEIHALNDYFTIISE